MQIMVNVGMTPQEYAERFEEILWQVPRVCPMCGAHKTPHRHGYYERNALPKTLSELVVKIRRFRCPICRRTLSFLPSFLLPHFQYVTELIVMALLGKKRICRGLLRFYWKRFLHNANGILAMLRDKGMEDTLPKTKKERAMKLLRSIENLGSGNFSMLYHRINRRGFMADSSYLQVRFG